MSAPKFTPWRIDYARCTGYIVRSQDGLSLIVDYMDDNCEHGAIESEEHARLIAAAPELYEALEAFFDGYLAADVKELDAMYIKTRAALAKARGEA